MSEYHKVDLGLSNQKHILNVLNQMGYKPQIHDEAQQLHGYRGDKRKQKAHIVIPRSQVGAASNDLGFERLSNGQYRMHISQFDISAKRFNQAKFQQLYNEADVQEKLRNSSRFKVVKKRVDDKGNIRIVVRRG